MTKLFDELSEENFILFAAKHYDNPQCLDVDEFYEDLARFKYLRRLFNRYEQSGVIQERLILNHLIILTNVFKIVPAVKMLFYKIDNSQWSILKTFLVYMNCLTEHEFVEVPLDLHIIQKLRKI